MTGDRLGPGQPEVGQLELPLVGDEQVLRLHVPEQQGLVLVSLIR